MFKTETSRYTKNKVLFSVPCVYARESFFFGLGQTSPIRNTSSSKTSLDTGILCKEMSVRSRVQINQSQPVQLFTPRNNLGSSVLSQFKNKPQGTLKTRYFLVYLACMRARRSFPGVGKLSSSKVFSKLRPSSGQVQSCSQRFRTG